MNFPPASPASLAAFVVLVVAVAGILVWFIGRAYRSAKVATVAAVVFALWLAVQAALVASGRLTSLPLNGLPFLLVPAFAIWTALALSPVGRRVASTIPLTALVGFQAFRLPLELILHEWANQGVIPSTMTWTGQNWDIISGIVALAAAPFATRFPAGVRVANIVGFALLLNVMRVAILSSPVPFGWGQQPPLLLAFHLPYMFIVPVCVGGALFGHLVLTRALWRHPSPSL